jgi:hypothetical protein
MDGVHLREGYAGSDRGGLEEEMDWGKRRLEAAETVAVNGSADEAEGDRCGVLGGSDLEGSDSAVDSHVRNGNGGALGGEESSKGFRGRTGGETGDREGVADRLREQGTGVVVRRHFDEGRGVHGGSDLGSGDVQLSDGRHADQEGKREGQVSGVTDKRKEGRVTHETGWAQDSLHGSSDLGQTLKRCHHDLDAKGDVR